MKKIFYFIIFIGLSLISSGIYAVIPEAKFDIYGIQKCISLAEYQKYIGETVIYLPKEPPSYKEQYEFKGMFNTEYVISKITGSDKKMKFLLQEKNGKSKVKMVVHNGESYRYEEYTYCITNNYSVPLFLIDKFNKDKPQVIGKKYSNEKAKAEYKVIDVIMQTNKFKYSFADPYPTIHYVLQNSITGETITVPAESAQEDCFMKDLSGKYVSTLVKVEKPVDEAIRYGKTKLMELEGITKYNYIDDYIDIIIFGNRTQFKFLLKNISQNTLKLVWNEAVFVGFNGSTSKVMHTGTTYSKKNDDQPVSTIIKGATIDDIIVPTCNVRYSDISKEWVTDTMYPNEPEKSPGELKLMLPIQVKDVVNEYIFIFKVDWVFNHPELIK